MSSSLSCCVAPTTPPSSSVPRFPHLETAGRQSSDCLEMKAEEGQVIFLGYSQGDARSLKERTVTWTLAGCPHSGGPQNQAGDEQSGVAVLRESFPQAACFPFLLLMEPFDSLRTTAHKQAAGAPGREAAGRGGDCGHLKRRPLLGSSGLFQAGMHHTCFAQDKGWSRLLRKHSQFKHVQN